MDESAADPKMLLADRGYDADAIRSEVEVTCETTMISTTSNRTIRIPHTTS